MDIELQKIIELCRDPMVALEDNKVTMLNLSARTVFPDFSEGASAVGIIPEHILAETAESFLSSVIICGSSYSVFALRKKNTLLLSFAAANTAAALRGCVSDSLMSSMMTALFNIGLATERIWAKLDSPDADTLKYCAALNHNYYSLKHKLSNLHTFFALSENSMLIVPRYADLAALCRDTAASVSLLTRGIAAPIEYSCSSETLSAYVDAPKVELLILNLLSNALKHTPTDGLVRLRLSKSGENAVIAVDDNGCGIAPEKLKTVFSDYENRLDEHSLTNPGTGGLGLGICRSIAEKHGGALILESRHGEGTSVRVLLPLSPPGDTMLRSDLPPYENGGMNVILTELCDVLDTHAYEPKYLD